MSSDDMDKDLEFIKRKKLLKYYKEYLRKQMEALSKKEEKDKDIYEKVRQFFDEEAYKWLLSIRKRNSETADAILKNIIFLLLNGLLNIPIDYTAVEYLRRKIEGESGKIYIYKKGEFKELGDKLREK